jgi:hypothetical protein
MTAGIGPRQHVASTCSNHSVVSECMQMEGAQDTGFSVHDMGVNEEFIVSYGRYSLLMFL